MLNENGQSEGGVALLVDFENLVLSAGGRREVDCGALLTLAAGYGPVCGANLYADWRTRTMRGYPDDLFGLGVEFVQVVGRRRGRVLKNAVDVRMAVDALALVHAMPCIDVFVLVTGDRDFVHVAQALRREGKRVVGVAPEDGASAELAAMCDRFVYYEAIAWRAGPRPGAAGGGGAVRALARGGRAAGPAVRQVLGFLRGTRRSGRRHGIGDSPGRGNGGDCGHAPPADAAGGPRGKGWDWFEWARERIGGGAVAANAEGSWLHRLGDDALVVVPDCFEEHAALEGVGAKTVKNRVTKLGLHRLRSSGGGKVDLFRAVVGDGRTVSGMLFRGRLLWGDDEPEDGSATLA